MIEVEYRSGFHDAPKQATAQSAGFDVRSDDAVLIHPGAVVLVATPYRLSMPSGYAALLFGRSGLATKGIGLANGVGVIDSDYQGIIKVALHNFGSSPYAVSVGDRIAQLVFIRPETVKWVRVGQFVPSERGIGGFGSTGTV